MGSQTPCTPAIAQNHLILGRSICAYHLRKSSTCSGPKSRVFGQEIHGGSPRFQGELLRVASPVPSNCSLRGTKAVAAEAPRNGHKALGRVVVEVDNEPSVTS